MMKTLIVYDSQFGNTEQVAKAIGDALGSEASVIHVDSAEAEKLGEYELVIVGSPTQGGRPTPAVKAFLDRIPDGGLKGVGVAGFDTRVDSATQGFFLKALIGVIGYAAPRITLKLEAKGGKLIAEPLGLIVEGKEGPLQAGELERAIIWVSKFVRVRAAL
jgi:flavodoxin